MDNEAEVPKQYTLIAPTKQLPSNLKGTGQGPTAQFLVGYRNILTQNGEGKVEWGLVKNNKYCGRAYCFSITSTEASTIQQSNQQDQQVQVIGGTMLILLKIATSIVKPDPLSPENVQRLLQQLGSVDRITLNLLQSSFETFAQYRQTIGDFVQSRIQSKPAQLQMPDRIKIEIQGKKLSGQNLRNVPQVSKQTGEWGQAEIALKLSE